MVIKMSLKGKRGYLIMPKDNLGKFAQYCEPGDIGDVRMIDESGQWHKTKYIIDHQYRSTDQGLNGKKPEVHLLIPIHSLYKGPIYTIPGPQAISQYETDVNVEIEVTYKHADTPPFDSVVARFNNVTKRNIRFMVAPFVKSLLALSDYNSQARTLDREIVISQIRISSFNRMDYEKIAIYRDIDTTTAPIAHGSKKSILNQYGFDENTNYFFESNNGISMTAEYSDRHFVNVPNSGVCYGLRWHEYDALHAIKSMKLQLFSNDVLNGDPRYELELMNISDILSACLYLPDLMYFDNHFFGDVFSYRITEELSGNPNFVIIERSYVMENKDSMNIFKAICEETFPLL